MRTTAIETYCECGAETELEFCLGCGSTARFSFETVVKTEDRPPRVIYLLTGIALLLGAAGAVAWMFA